MPEWCSRRPLSAYLGSCGEQCAQFMLTLKICVIHNVCSFKTTKMLTNLMAQIGVSTAEPF